MEHLILSVSNVSFSYSIYDDSLLQNVTDILLQNATTFLLQNAREAFYKMRQFNYKMRRLLRTATISEHQ